MAELGEHFVGGALERFAGDDGAHGENFFFVGAQLIADLGHGQNRADADQGIAGADDDAVGGANGFENARCGLS